MCPKKLKNPLRVLSKIKHITQVGKEFCIFLCTSRKSKKKRAYKIGDRERKNYVLYTIKY